MNPHLQHLQQSHAEGSDGLAAAGDDGGRSAQLLYPGGLKLGHGSYGRGFHVSKASGHHQTQQLAVPGGRKRGRPSKLNRAKALLSATLASDHAAAAAAAGAATSEQATVQAETFISSVREDHLSNILTPTGDNGSHYHLNEEAALNSFDVLLDVETFASDEVIALDEGVAFVDTIATNSVIDNIEPTPRTSEVLLDVDLNGKSREEDDAMAVAGIDFEVEVE